MNLSDKKCAPCEGGVEPLRENEVNMYMKLINPAWELEGSNKILREFQFVNFVHAMAFVNKVADIAEAEGHHPDMHVSYGSCKILIWTHAIDGLSENDFILASKIDML